VTHGKLIGCRLRRAALLSVATMQALAAAPHGALPSITTQYALADQSFRAGDYSRAEQLYGKILAAHGDEPNAWFRIGLIQQRRHAFKAALNAYDNALACAPDQGTEELAQVLAKIRFNRSVLLLESAAKDLKSIPPGTLKEDLDGIRENLAAHVDAALLAAEAPAVEAPPQTARSDPSSARGYLYEVRTPVTTGSPRP
jgi:tetratricopeptide (TPR) repeat protein